jgi:prophage regulatory protein
MQKSLQKLYRLPEVMKFTGWSRPKIYAEMHEGRFPRQVRVSPMTVAWLEDELVQWQAERIAQRDAKLAKRAQT